MSNAEEPAACSECGCEILGNMNEHNRIIHDGLVPHGRVNG